MSIRKGIQCSMMVLGLAAASSDAQTFTPSPNPGQQSPDNTISSFDIFDCLQKDNIICFDRTASFGAYSCVTNKISDSKLTDSNYLCTDKYTDKIFQHAIGSFAENGDCPKDQIAESTGATGKLVFPHGKQTCTTAITTKCGGPSFKLDRNLSIEPSDYEIYWTEWDTNMTIKPLEYLDEQVNLVAATVDMSPHKRWPPFKQEFEYTGLGSEKTAGYPGTDGVCTNYFSINCWGNKPDAPGDLERLRKLNYGIGKPTSGMYDTKIGGWHTFGGQGQLEDSYSSTEEPPIGWKPTHWQECGERYLLVTVVNKLDSFQNATSRVVIDIGISQLENKSQTLLVGMFATFVAFASTYF